MAETAVTALAIEEEHTGSGETRHASGVEGGASDVVHMLWIGEQGIPDFPRRCIASYVSVGNTVHLWVYPQQQPSASALPSGVTVRDANEIIPLETALDIGYYHGMGGDLRWPSWSTFSDLFRYELLYKEGGWWCDADSVAVQCLHTAGFPAGGHHVFATEHWRPGGYRNITLAIPKPGTQDAGRLPEYLNGGTRDEAKMWREARKDQHVHCCVITNSHIRAPRRSALMRSCADELRPLMEAYAAQCKRFPLGDEGVDWALPTGGEGLRIFQEQVAARIVGGGPEAGEFLQAVQHYARFNPVEIDDFPGGHRVLQGERHVPAATCTVHFFGMIRDNWKMLNFDVSSPFRIVRDDDNDQLLTDIKKVESRLIRAERERQKRERAAAKQDDVRPPSAHEIAQ